MFNPTATLSKLVLLSQDEVNMTIRYFKKRPQFRPEKHNDELAEVINLSELREKAIEKKAVFDQTVITILKKIDPDCYQLSKGKTLDDVTSLKEVGIHVTKLLDCAHESSGMQTLRYAIAGIYNNLKTVTDLRIDLLDELESQGFITINEYPKLLDVSFPTNALFGAACQSLDDENKELLTKLILNYRGW